MSIAKCFSNLNNAELQSLYQSKVEDGMTSDAAAAAAISEYAKVLSEKNNRLREKLGLPTTKAPNTNALKEIIENPTETIGSMPNDLYILTEPDVTTQPEQDTEVDEERIELMHRTPDGTMTPSYREALVLTPEGRPIEIGFKVGDEFLPLVTTNKSTNRNTVDGFVNFMVESGVLSESKVPNMQGDLVFEAEGNSELRQAFTTALLQDQAPAYLGMNGVTRDGFTFKINDNADNVTILDKNGALTVAKKSELDQMSYEQLQSKYGNFTAIITVAEREFAASREPYRNTPLILNEAEPAMPEDQLTLRLMNLLNKLGVKVTTLTEYNKKYKMRNGVNPGAKALADIANQVIALGEGRVEALTEETAHFINEALPQDKVRNILRNIHKSEEWAQYAEAYREIYRNEYPEDQLDEVVRREVLGKIVAKVLAEPSLMSTTQNETQRNFFQRAYDFVMEFIDSIISSMNAEYRNELESYKDEVRKLMRQEEIANLVETDNFKDNTFRFYQLDQTMDDIDKLRTRAQVLARKLQDAEKVLLNAGTGSRANLKDLERIQDELNDERNIESISAILSVMNNYVKRLNIAVKQSEKDEKPFVFSDEENILYQFVKGFGRKGVDEIRTLIDGAKKIAPRAKHKSYNLMQETADQLSLDMAALESRANLIDSRNVELLVERTMDKYNIPEQDRELVTRWIEKAEHDTNMFHFAFGQLVHAKDGLLNLTGHILRKMNHEANVDFYHATKNYQQKLRDLGVTPQDIGKFVDGNFIVSEYNWNEFYKDMDNIFAETLVQGMVNEIARIRQENESSELSQPVRERNDNLIKRYSTFLKEVGMVGDDFSKLTAEQKNTVLEAVKKRRVERELPEISPELQTARKNLERAKVFPPDGDPLQVRPMKDEYYEKYEENMKKAGVAETSKQLLSNLMSDMGDLRKKAFVRQEDGTVVLDYTSLSEGDLMTLKDLQRRRKMLKSYTKPNGELKKGLMYVFNDDGTPQLDEKGNRVVVENPDDVAAGEVSAEARAAIDLHNLDKLLPKNSEEKSAKLFYDTLDKIDKEKGRVAALRFLEANTFLTFKQNFWEGLGDADNLVQRLVEYKNRAATPEEMDTVVNLISQISGRSFALKSILKQNSKKANPAETDVESMPKHILDEIKQIQEQLSQNRMMANAILKDFTYPGMQRAGREVEAVSEVNDSYMAALEDAGHLDDANDDAVTRQAKASAEISFAQQHMTEYNANSLGASKLKAKNFRDGITDRLDGFTQDILEQMGKTKDDLRQDPFVLPELWRQMARAKVLPYYKRFAPAAYREFQEGLATTENLVEYLQGEQAQRAFVEITPNYSFFDQQENDMINPEFDRNFKGGYRQPNLKKYSNPKFEQMFGKIVDGKSTKDDKMYQAYLATMEYNEAALDAMNVGENYNKFRLPQIRKGLVERVSKAFTGNVMGNLRNAALDTLRFTEDDMVQGEQLSGSTVKVIPKMYVSELQNPEDVSNDLFFSLAMRAKEGYLRKAKLRHYGDLMSLQDKILNREMNGKEPDKSNTYKMFQSALDYSIFGIKEVITAEVNVPLLGKIDLAKFGRLMLKYVKFRNLGLNVVIPATSWLTGDITRKIEATIGDYVDLRSQAKGRNEFARIGPAGMKEIGDIDPGAKINALGQYFGAFDLMESFKSSNYNKLFRNLPKSGMMLHAAANYPLYGTTLLGILHDFRIVDGEVIDRNQYKNRKGVKGWMPKEIDKQWESLEKLPDGNSALIYDFIIHNKNEVRFDREKLKKYLMKDGASVTEENIDQAISDISERIQGKVQFVNSIIDGQIPENDRVFAQRNFLLSYLMTHRGWLSIALARRFKNRHLNFDTQVAEEGSYRSMGGYLSGILNEFNLTKPQTFFTAWKKAWDNADDMQRKNIKRVGVEFGALTAIMGIGLLLRYAAEDPENEDNAYIQGVNYLWFRVSSELSSVQLNIASNFSEAVEAPFVGWDTMKNIMKMGDLLSDEEIKYGSYRGMTERGRFLTRMVPGAKQYYDLSNLNQTYETYKFYNRKNFSGAFLGNLLWMNTIDAPEGSNEDFDVIQ